MSCHDHAQSVMLAEDTDDFNLHEEWDDDPWMDIEHFMQRHPMQMHIYHIVKNLNPSQVPLDLENDDINSPKDLNEDQLNLIEHAIAHITLQGFCNFDWSDLCFQCGIPHTIIGPFRHKLFKTLAKHVLTLYDLEDFQRCADEANINTRNELLLQHLHNLYGKEPESFGRAMTDISQRKLDLSQFPLLWEQDLGFTLEFLDINVHPTKHYLRSEHSWPFVLSPIDKDCDIYENHLKSVREALYEYEPLNEDERMDLLMEMKQEPLFMKTEQGPSFVEDKEERLGPLMEALCVQPWKDIKPSDFDGFETPVFSPWFRDMLFPQRLFFIIKDLAIKKATMVRFSKKCATFPLRSGVLGTFTEEVLEVVEIANLTRIRRRQRLLSADLILSVILQSRIGDCVNTLLLLSGQTPACLSKRYPYEKYPIYYIYSLAGDVARILECGGTSDIKLEHVVLAIVFEEPQKMDENQWKVILGKSFVVRFLAECDRVCGSGATPPLSPEKKKMKHSGVTPTELLHQTPGVPRRYSWAYMEFIVDALEHDLCLTREQTFGRVRAERQESSMSGGLMGYRKGFCLKPVTPCV